MPYDPPAEYLGIETAEDEETRKERVQELEVRRTVQEILRDHLRPGLDLSNPRETFWSDIDLNLIGAVLVNLYLNGCTLQRGKFGRATFVGRTEFLSTTFTLAGYMHTANFLGPVSFAGARFASDAVFSDTKFHGQVSFNSAAFEGYTMFESTTFAGDVSFSLVRFEGGRSSLVREYLKSSGQHPESHTSFRNSTFVHQTPPEVAAFLKQDDGPGASKV